MPNHTTTDRAKEILLLFNTPIEFRGTPLMDHPKNYQDAFPEARRRVAKEAMGKLIEITHYKKDVASEEYRKQEMQDSMKLLVHLQRFGGLSTEDVVQVFKKHTTRAEGVELFKAFYIEELERRLKEEPRKFDLQDPLDKLAAEARKLDTKENLESAKRSVEFGFHPEKKEALDKVAALITSSAKIPFSVKEILNKDTTWVSHNYLIDRLREDPNLNTATKTRLASTISALKPIPATSLSR
jgi:hypothetical protein